LHLKICYAFISCLNSKHGLGPSALQCWGPPQARGSPGWFLTERNSYFVGRLQDTLPIAVRDIFAVLFLSVMLDNSAHALVDIVLYVHKYFQIL